MNLRQNTVEFDWMRNLLTTKCLSSMKRCKNSRLDYTQLHTNTYNFVCSLQVFFMQTCCNPSVKNQCTNICDQTCLDPSCHFTDLLKSGYLSCDTQHLLKHDSNRGQHSNSKVGFNFYLFVFIDQWYHLFSHTDRILCIKVCQRVKLVFPLEEYTSVYEYANIFEFLFLSWRLI